MKTVTVNKNDASQRIDKFLGKYFKEARELLAERGVRIEINPD